MTEGGFLSRWSQRKQQNQNMDLQDIPAVDVPDNLSDPLDHLQNPIDQSLGLDESLNIDSSTDSPNTQADTVYEPEHRLTDEDMPDIASIDGNSDISAFFSEGVSEQLRKQALKAMFIKPEFNLRDGMDDYDMDYTKVKTLSSEVASGLRQWFKEKEPIDPELLESNAPKADLLEAVESKQEPLEQEAIESELSESEPIEPELIEPETLDTDHPPEVGNTDQVDPDKSELDQIQMNLASDKATVADLNSVLKEG
jgi:hypothetical protein